VLTICTGVVLAGDTVLEKKTSTVDVAPNVGDPAASCVDVDTWEVLSANTDVTVDEIVVPVKRVGVVPGVVVSGVAEVDVRDEPVPAVWVVAEGVDAGEAVVTVCSGVVEAVAADGSVVVACVGVVPVPTVAEVVVPVKRVGVVPGVVVSGVAEVDVRDEPVPAVWVVAEGVDAGEAVVTVCSGVVEAVAADGSVVVACVGVVPVPTVAEVVVPVKRVGVVLGVVVSGVAEVDVRDEPVPAVWVVAEGVDAGETVVTVCLREWWKRDAGERRTEAWWWLVWASFRCRQLPRLLCRWRESEWFLG
jgi:hypothetical protein